MNFVTKEEFNAKVEVINTKIDNLNYKIESSNENTINKLKLYISEENKKIVKESTELKKWIIGAIIIPIIIAIIPLFFR